MSTLTEMPPIDEQTLEELEAWGFEGIDASLDISLGEYGLACWYDNVHEEYFCIVGYQTDEAGNYTSFYTSCIEAEEIHEEAKDLGGASFFDSLGTELSTWKKQPDITKIHDLKNLIGPENIFGTPQHTFQLIALET